MHGFTLIELLAVITIILILASIALGIAKYATDHSRRARAEADLRRYQAAAEAHHKRCAHYSGINTGISQCKGIDRTDPWGTAYGSTAFDVNTGRYTSGNSVGKQLYIFFSHGPDARPGAAEVDDDGDGRVDETRDPGDNYDDVSEVGYGDDIVVGNTTIKRGFPEN